LRWRSSATTPAASAGVRIRTSSSWSTAIEPKVVSANQPICREVSSPPAAPIHQAKFCQRTTSKNNA